MGLPDARTHARTEIWHHYSTYVGGRLWDRPSVCSPYFAGQVCAVPYIAGSVWVKSFPHMANGHVWSD